MKVIPNLFGATGQYVRASFLSTLERLCADTHLYSTVTPEFTATNVNILGYRWRKESRSSVTMLMAETMIQQIRNTGTAACTNTTQPQVNRRSRTEQSSPPHLPGPFKPLFSGSRCERCPIPLQQQPIRPSTSC